MRSRFRYDKGLETNTIMTIKPKERSLDSLEISSVRSNLPEDESKTGLKENASNKTHYPLSIAKRMINVKHESFEDVKELITMLKEIDRRTEELNKHADEIQQQLSTISTRSENIQKALM